MPIYEYECGDCGHHFEELQSFSDEPIDVCPECGGKVRRLISSGAALIFKGSGFYITDYKKKENSSTMSGADSESSSKKSESSAATEKASSSSSEKKDVSPSEKSDDS